MPMFTSTSTLSHSKPPRANSNPLPREHDDVTNKRALMTSRDDDVTKMMMGEEKSEIVTINVAGARFQTRRSTLQRFPETLLGSPEIEHYYEPSLGEYYFDRSRSVFERILSYYQSDGVICLPSHINPDLFVSELKFFKMGDRIITKFIAEDTKNKVIESNKDKYWHPVQEQLWMWLDNPDDGLIAKFVAYFDLAIIVIAVAAQCVESLPSIRMQGGEGDSMWGSSTASRILFTIETVSNAWFTVSFVARLICCPDKKEFSKSMLNWFDLLAILPFYLDLIFTDSKNLNFLMVLRFFRTLRIVRIFKMSRYFQGLFALGYALSSSAGELVILALMLITFVVLFSSLIYFTESGELMEGEAISDVMLTVDLTNLNIKVVVGNVTVMSSESTAHDLTGILSKVTELKLSLVEGNTEIIIPNVLSSVTNSENKFDSIITGFWWSIVTMSTVGYGDYVPRTHLGKAIGSLCALTGILVISLPFPLIISRFNNFMKLKSTGNSRYSTIRDGLSQHDVPLVPEYTGLAYGFYNGDNRPRVEI